MPPVLTALALFTEAKKAEIEGNGRKLPTVEAIEAFRALSEEDRNTWSEKAASAQEAYLQESTKRFLEAGADDEDEGEDGEDGDGDGDDAEEDTETSGFEGPLRIAVSKVKKLAEKGLSDTLTVSRVSKEANFAFGKAAELFVEHLAWSTLRVMSRDTRKTMTLSHVTSAMRMSSAPEAFQYFLEELQPAPPEPPPPPPPKKRAPKEKGPPKEKKEPKEKPPPKEPKPEKPKAPPTKRQRDIGGPPSSITNGIHPDKQCDRSGMCPIVGIRYHLTGASACIGAHALPLPPSLLAMSLLALPLACTLACAPRLMLTRSHRRHGRIAGTVASTDAIVCSRLASPRLRRRLRPLPGRVRQTASRRAAKLHAHRADAPAAGQPFADEEEGAKACCVSLLRQEAGLHESVLRAANPACRGSEGRRCLLFGRHTTPANVHQVEVRLARWRPPAPRFTTLLSRHVCD